MTVHKFGYDVRLYFPICTCVTNYDSFLVFQQCFYTTWSTHLVSNVAVLHNATHQLSEPLHKTSHMFVTSMYVVYNLFLFILSEVEFWKPNKFMQCGTFLDFWSTNICSPVNPIIPKFEYNL